MTMPPETDSAPPPTSPPFRLHYAEPAPRPPLLDPDHLAVRIGRRLIFAIGCGLLAFGVISVWGSVNRTDAPYCAAWGAGLIALTVPGWRRTPHM